MSFRGNVTKTLLAFLISGFIVPVVAAEGFQVGACLHSARPNYAQVKSLLDDAHLSIRDDVPWSFIEVKKGSLEFSPKLQNLEQLVDDAVAHKRRPLLILDYGNNFYDGGGMPKSPEAIAAFTRYAVFVVQHFKGRVSQFEVWNEWNGGLGARPPGPQKADGYVALLKETYRAVKQADPSVTVIGGVLSWTDPVWLQQFAQAGGFSYLDAFSVHTYNFNSTVPPGSHEHVRETLAGGSFAPFKGTPEAAIGNLDAFKAKLDSLAGGKSVPIFVSEMGWPTFSGKEGVSEQHAAVYAQRFLLLARARPWLAGVWWYDLVDDGGSRTYSQDNFGLLHGDHSPKPAYEAIRNVVDIVTSTKPVSVSTNADGVTVATGYRPSGEQVKISWLATNDPGARAGHSPDREARAGLRAQREAEKDAGGVTFTPSIVAQH
jgi:hypothetical protein